MQTHFSLLRTFCSPEPWASAWAKGIQYRREANQDVGGFFAQLGQLYVLYQIWVYPSMSDRNDTCHATWAKPGWDATVANTEYGDIKITPEHYREANMTDLDELKEILNLSIFLECDDFTRCIGFVIAKKLNKMKIEEIADFCGFSSPAPHRSLLLEDIHKSVEESN